MKLFNLTFLLFFLQYYFSGNETIQKPANIPTTVDITTNAVEPEASNILYQSTDGGRTWQDIGYSLPINEQPEDFFVSESFIYLRVMDGIYRSKSNLKTPFWEKHAFDPQTTSNIVESDGVLIGTGQKGIRRSIDNGEHWEWVISEGGVGIAVENIRGGFAAIVYNDKAKSRKIYASMDNGKTWKNIDQGLRPALSISSVKQIGNYLICGHPDGILRSADFGKTWTTVHPGVSKVEFKYVNAFTPPVADSGKVFRLHVSGNVVYAVAQLSGC